ncbi:AraC family transcriptional regulator [Gemmatimonas aurantiaca]|uniref:AraC family transcriptional regulator n=1 Tax=Gemmatimonas aurantiaca TaxID=173480 RepID=UPI00301D409F
MSRTPIPPLPPLLSSATMSVGYTEGVLEYAVERGCHRTRLLHAAGIDAVALTHPDHRIPLAAYLRLVRQASAMTGDSALALHWGAAVACAQVSVVGAIGSASGTVADAFVQLNRFARLSFDFGEAPDVDRYRIERVEEGIWMFDTRPHVDSTRELTESTFARFAVGMRLRASHPVLRAVHFSYDAPSHAQEYADVFQVPVTFGTDRNALLLDPAWWDHPLQATPRTTHRILASHADAQLAALQRTRSCRGRVEAVVRPLLAEGAVSMPAVASALSMSRQTLLRNLKAEGTTFAEVVAGLRESLALHYLAEQKATVQQTAALLGFSEAAAFSRAFKRWTGKSPRAFVDDARDDMRDGTRPDRASARA